MRKADHLGNFELYVLAALEHLGDDAYGVAIHGEIEARSGRPTAVGSVYVTLERLAQKGFVTFQISEPLPAPGGRARKHVYLTRAGRRAFHEAIRALDRMLVGIRLAPSASGKR
jgi:PadR family transcriptional regulator, regulatory protein PadR